MGRTLERRAFIRDLGGGILGVAVFGLAACSGESTDTTRGASSVPVLATTTAVPPDTTVTTAPPPLDVAWSRIVLGGVSAYFTVGSGVVTLVDTGNPGAADDIEEALTQIGVGWSDVGHVIVTHRHTDHQGSLGAVMEAASDAIGYVGVGDLVFIDSPRELVAVSDGDRVGDLVIVDTPGHTDGHISIHDPAAGVLVAGDALNGGDAVGGAAGSVAGPNPQYTPDMSTAIDSVERVAALTYATAFFGHGSPVLTGADVAVRALAAALAS